MSVRFRDKFDQLIDATKALIEAGADPTIVSQEGISSDPDFVGLDAFDLAIWKNNFEAVQLMVDVAANYPTLMDSSFVMKNKHFSPLSLAAYLGRANIVTEIVERSQVDIDQQTTDLHHTALYEAASAWRDLEIENRTKAQVEADYVEIIRTLREAGADPNLSALAGQAAAESNNTPLIIATSEGHCERVEEIAKFATIDFGQANSVGDNALHKAVMKGWDNNCGQILVEGHKFDSAINNKNNIGNTPLHYAVSVKTTDNGEVNNWPAFKALVEHEADYDTIKNDMGQLPHQMIINRL